MAKYADDGAAVADTPEGLRDMIREIGKYADRNKLNVNAKKTKIMVFRKGGKNKDKRSEYKGERLEVVNSFKYLGYTFTTGNSNEKHMREMKRKANKTANATWGVVKRTERNNMRDRMYLYSTLVRAGCMYGVETWGGEEGKGIKIIQNKVERMTLGVAGNTPGYIVRKEVNSEMIEWIVKDRMWRYIIEVTRMGEERWPKICLREEMRGILNKAPTKWGDKVEKITKIMECEKVIKMIYEGAETEEIEKDWRNTGRQCKRENQKKLRTQATGKHTKNW